MMSDEVKDLIMLRTRRLCCLRKETAAGSPKAGFSLIEVFSALLRGEAQIVAGVLELAYSRAAGDGEAFPQRALPGFRLSS